MARDKTHTEQVERWAVFVRNNPREKWKPAITSLINSQYEMARRFYKNLAKTKKGREILKRLKEERKRKSAQ